MDGERKIHMSEDVPLNSAGAANIFLNTGKSNKINSSNGTVIQLKTEKPADLGVHINTTFSVASSKKIRLLFVLNFLLCVICMILSCSVAFYYWNEIISMRKQLDLLKEQFMTQTPGQDKVQSSPLVYQKPLLASEARHPRMEEGLNYNKDVQSPRRYFVEDLGDDMLLIDSKRKNPSKLNPAHDLALANKELLVVQFNGAAREINMGSQSIIGPWVRDSEVSSRGSDSKIQLNGNYVTVQEGGVYFIYTQVVYLSQSPSCFFLWARTSGGPPRLLATCASADDGSRRPHDKSQLSCSTITAARLHPGDIVNLAQREQNRTIWLRPGYSYFGFIKLSS